MTWFKAHDFEVVVLESDEVLAPSGFDVLHETITLLSKRIINHNIVPISQHRAHCLSALFGSNTVVHRIRAILANSVEGGNV